MKKIYISLAAVFISLLSFGQTSVQNGNWQNPMTWDCSCIPNPFFTAIDVTVNHAVIVDINNGGLYFEGGSLTVGSNGSLIQSGAGDLYMHNATTVVDGTLDMRRVAIAGGTGTYNGVIQNCDSLWSDSSTVINNGTITCYDHQVYPDGIMTNNGTIRMTHDMNIMGEYTNGSTGIIYIDNDFSNANILGGRAMYINNGDHQIANNFINTTNDTLKGTGTLCIGNLSTNEGTVLGTLTVSTPSGGFSLNTGFVAPSVSFNTNSCSLSTVENSKKEARVYPNPFTSQVSITGVNKLSKVEIYDIDGRLIRNENMVGTTVDLSSLESGVYFMKATDTTGRYLIRKIIKQ